MSPTKKTDCKLSTIEDAQKRRGTSRQWLSPRPVALILMATAVALGGGGMLIWLVFLLVGPLVKPYFGFGASGGLLLDTFLCLLFFSQHSIMVRQKFRLWLTKTVHAGLHGALYATVSGICLLLLVFLWQPVGPSLWIPQQWARWTLLGVFLAAGIGATWGFQALGNFDGLGIRSAHRAGQQTTPAVFVPFIVRGPYRWVRHPLYFFSLVMIWSGPVFTVDRLLHNGLFTIWIVIGAFKEEQDLMQCFGESYRSYRNAVPMLLPRRMTPSMPEIIENLPPPPQDRRDSATP